MQFAMRRTPSAKTSCREGIVTFSGKKERAGPKHRKEVKKKLGELKPSIFFFLVPALPLFFFFPFPPSSFFSWL